MMKPSILEDLPAQYITDESGNKMAVILKIDVYKRLIEELEDASLGKIAEEILKNDTQRYSLDDIKRENDRKNKK